MTIMPAETMFCEWNCGKGAHVTQNVPRSPRSGPIVLITSDDPEICSEVQVVLTTAGIETSVANSESAVEIANQLSPNLVLLDAGSPTRDGLDLCRVLHVENSCWRSPIIFISDPGEIPAKVRALQCGAVDYLTKPLNMLEVVARVRTHLRLQHAMEMVADLHAEHLQLLAGAQQSCMPRPRDLPDARFHVALRHVHHAGGDFYDVVGLGSNQFDYIVADASGHDLSSTYWTLALKTLLVEYSNPLFSPLDALYLINRALLRILPDEVFFTAAYVRLNRRTGQLFLLNAGHTPAIYVPARGQHTARVIQQKSDVLGAFSDATFTRVDLDVRPGDRLFLFSDGLTDCPKTGGDGLQRLVQSLSGSRKQPLQVVVEGVLNEQLQGCTPVDDALLMGIEV